MEYGYQVEADYSDWYRYRNMAAWVEGRVHDLHPWTDRLFSLQVEAGLDPFRAGQFTRLALEIDGELIARPYSFVNAPDNPLHEFYFITVPGGPLTQRLSKLAAGDSVPESRHAGGARIAVR